MILLMLVTVYHDFGTNIAEFSLAGLTIECQFVKMRVDWHSMRESAK